MATQKSIQTYVCALFLLLKLSWRWSIIAITINKVWNNDIRIDQSKSSASNGQNGLKNDKNFSTVKNVYTWWFRKVIGISIKCNHSNKWDKINHCEGFFNFQNRFWVKSMLVTKPKCVGDMFDMLTTDLTVTKTFIF